MINDLKKLLLLCCICISFLTCEKTNFNYKNYSAYDSSGTPTGPADSDDWNFDDIWSKRVTKLFDEHVSGDCGSEHKRAVEIFDLVNPPPQPDQIFAYPNPASGSFLLYIRIQQEGMLQYILVDESKNVYTSGCEENTKGDNIIKINISEVSSKGMLYRFFYKYITESDVYYGHGDIFVE